jgi:alanine dehydrogenase
MLIGIPKKIKVEEYRVGLTPDSVRQYVSHGHKVLVEKEAGIGLGCSNEDYTKAGAQIADSAAEIFAEADMIVKVKEPQPAERAMLRQDQILFTYLHLAPDPDQTNDLLKSGAICIAYETVTNQHGHLPLLAPMSQVAGRLSIQAGARCLEKEMGGRGVLLGGVPGVAPAKVTVVGGGVVGEHAIIMALGLGADVTVLDNNVETLERLEIRYGVALKTVFSTPTATEDHVVASDLVIGAVLVAGAEAPKLVSADMVKQMQTGSVLVDVAIDQGGCFETSKATTHKDPTYVIDGVVHYCVANMPGAVPCTSTHALNNVTTPFGLAIAGKGWQQALSDDPHLRDGLNIFDGQITNEAVANALNQSYVEPASILKM